MGTYEKIKFKVLNCDLCPGEREKQELDTVPLGNMVTCHRLECGHWWHLSYSRLGSGDRGGYEVCNCPDYTPPLKKQMGG